MGKLSTHVLDTMQGRPAAGVAIDLFFLGGESRQHLAHYTTNVDGRTDAPLLASEDMVGGIFELVFHVGDYFAAQDVALPETPFLDRVPVRFGIDDPEAGYHVPLLVAPFGYSTYRGS